MSKKPALFLIAAVTLGPISVWAQGGGGGGGSGGGGSGAAGSASSSSSSAGAGTGTGASSAAGTSSQMSTPGTGTADQATQMGNISSQPGVGTRQSPNAQPNQTTGIANETPAQAQARRNAGAGHAPNGLPIGSPGTGTGGND